MVDSVGCDSFSVFLSAVRMQVRKHGRTALKARDFTNPGEMDYRIGFESPDGWWTVSLKQIKKAFPDSKERVRLFRKELDAAAATS